MAAVTTPDLPTGTVINKLREIIKEDDLSTWEQAWHQGVTPWNEGIVQPPLVDLLENGSVSTDLGDIVPLPRAPGRAFVPGCGVGRDVIQIASTLGLDSIGLEISQIAVNAANELLASLPTQPTGKVIFQQGDFFELNIPASERFDLIYDYTFFTAIPPAKRSEWGRKINDLLKPGAILITLVYPLLPPDARGPPYHIRGNHYAEVLGDSFERLTDYVPKVSAPGHSDRERVMVWRKLK